MRQGRQAAVRIRITAGPLGSRTFRVRVRRPSGGWVRSAPVWVRVSPQVELLSRRPGGDAGAGSSYQPTVSADGRYVAFTSLATDLASGQSATYSSVLVWTQGQGFRWRVGAAAFQRVTRGAAASEAPSLSGNGTVVAFESEDDALAPGDANLRDDVFTYAYR